MPMIFTMTRLKALKCPPGRRDALFFAKNQRGLGLRVLASGSKSYFAQYTDHGRKHRVPLGNFDAITLAQAADIVQGMQGDRARGIDPLLARRQAAAASRAMTFGQLIESWHDLHLKGRRAHYAKEATGTLRRLFAGCLSLPAGELDRAEIIPVIDRLCRAGSDSMATAAVSYGRALYGWAVKRGAVEVNPFVNLPVAASVKRERTLADEDELGPIWRATDGPGSFNGIVRVLALTGQRRDEVGGMRRPELSGDLSTWTIPGTRTKNRRTHIVPLSEPVRALLRGIPVTGELVFPGVRGVFNGYGAAKLALDKKSGVTGWRLHDLRRTCATGLQRLGVRLEITEAILNHVGGARGGLTGIYQRHTYQKEKRAALEAWAAHVMAIVSGKKLPQNVASIRTGGRHA